jgi:hypothetical protein
LIDEPQIGFVDKAGRLQGVIGAFALQILAGEPAQFFIDEWHQPCGRFAVASAPIDKHASHVFACWRGNHWRENGCCSDLSIEHGEYSSLRGVGNGIPGRRSIHPSAEIEKFFGPFFHGLPL